MRVRERSRQKIRQLSARGLCNLSEKRCTLFFLTFLPRRSPRSRPRSSLSGADVSHNPGCITAVQPVQASARPNEGCGPLASPAYSSSAYTAAPPQLRPRLLPVRARGCTMESKSEKANGALSTAQRALREKQGRGKKEKRKVGPGNLFDFDCRRSRVRGLKRYGGH